MLVDTSHITQYGYSASLSCKLRYKPVGVCVPVHSSKYWNDIFISGSVIPSNQTNLQKHVASGKYHVGVSQVSWYSNSALPDCDSELSKIIAIHISGCTDMLQLAVLALFVLSVIVNVVPDALIIRRPLLLSSPKGAAPLTI